jgi:lysophospholipase L1-like esterase
MSNVSPSGKPAAGETRDEPRSTRPMTAGRIALMGVALGCLGIAAALVAGEVALRLAGFHYETFPTVQFGWPEPTVVERAFVPDRELFWVPRDYDAMLANATRLHPTLVFLGDSCTRIGTWPQQTTELLRSRGLSVASTKLAVMGWSSVQGLAQFRRDVIPLHPRVATVYFGWNDHWVALGAPDKDARPGRVLFWLTQHSRLAQLAVKARLGVQALTTDRPERVDLPTYVKTLRAFAREGRAAGIAVLFITAPSGHERGHEPVYLARRHLRRLDDLVPLHQRYVEATRVAATERGGALCDAAAAFQALSPPAARYFRRDGIHLSAAGNREMAHIVADCVARVTAGPWASSAGYPSAGPFAFRHDAAQTAPRNGLGKR